MKIYTAQIRTTTDYQYLEMFILF